MNLDNLKKLIVPVLLKNEVIRAGIFGSYATGEHYDKSDIDILIDLVEGKSLLDLAGIKIELEEVTGKKVDVITYDSIYPKLRKEILEEEIEII